jgi:hypothetical protein
VRFGRGPIPAADEDRIAECRECKVDEAPAEALRTVGKPAEQVYVFGETFELATRRLVVNHAQATRTVPSRQRDPGSGVSPVAG